MKVGFHDNKAVRKVKVDKKINDIVNRLDKTRKELSPDFAAEREEYDRSVRAGAWFICTKLNAWELHARTQLPCVFEEKAAAAVLALLAVAAQRRFLPYPLASLRFAMQGGAPRPRRWRSGSLSKSASARSRPGIAFYNTNCISVSVTNAGRRAEAKAAAAEREQQKREHKKQEDLKHYKSLMDEEHMVSNRCGSNASKNKEKEQDSSSYATLLSFALISSFTQLLTPVC